MLYGRNGEGVDEVVREIKQKLSSFECEFHISVGCYASKNGEYAIFVANASYTKKRTVYDIEVDVKVNISCLFTTYDKKSSTTVRITILSETFKGLYHKEAWVDDEDLSLYVNKSITNCIKNVASFKKIKSLYHQNQLLGDGIRRIAFEVGIIHKDATPNGPELLMLVDNIIETITKEKG